MSNDILELTSDEQMRRCHEFSLRVAAKAVAHVGPVAIQRWVAANWPPAPSDDLNPEEWAYEFAHQRHAAPAESSHVLNKVRAILCLWDQADMDANVAYYGGPLGTRTQAESTCLLSRLSYVERARRDLLRLYAYTMGDKSPGELAFRERLDRLRDERHSVQAMAVWLGAVIDDTIARLDGTIPLDAPVPDCTNILATCSTVEQRIGDATAFFKAPAKT